MRITFTPEALRDLPAPARLPDGRVDQVRYWDNTMAGFGVRVSSNGRRRWVYQARVNGRTKVWTLPRGLDLWGARAEANRIQQRIESGDVHQAPALDVQPGAMLAASIPTFSEARDQFLKDAAKRLRASTVELYRQALDRLHDLDAKLLDEITRLDVARAAASIRDAGHPVAANRTVTYASAMLNWAARRGILDTAPNLRGLTLREAPRSRHLAGSPSMGEPCELPLVWAAAESLPVGYRAIVQLLILTGARCNEISCLRWNEFLDDGIMGPRIALPGWRVKNAHDFIIPIGTAARGILQSVPRLDSEFIFPAARGGKPNDARNGDMKRRLDAAVARIRAADSRFGDQLAKPWRLHDLRRTFATGLRQLGAPYEVIDALLNHVSGEAGRGTRPVYIHDDTWTQRRQFAELWERHVLEIVASEPAELAA